MFILSGKNISLASQYAPTIWLNKGIKRGGSCNCRERSGSPMPQMDLISFVQNYSPPTAVTNSRKDRGEKTFKCSRCSFTCVQDYRMRQHEQATHAVLSICSECELKFSCPKLLNEHLRTAHNEAVGKLCPYGCGSFKNLRSHNWTVHQEKRFECPKCQAMFSRKGHLTRHLVRDNSCV